MSGDHDECESMSDTERLDWIDEPMILPKIMHFWLQTEVATVRDAIDLYAEAVEKEDRENRDRPLEF